MAQELNHVKIGEIQIPVISNVIAAYIEKKEMIKECLKKQVMYHILWTRCIIKMIEEGVDTFIEIGPGKVLSGFLKKIDKNLTITNVEDILSLNNTLKLLEYRLCQVY